VLYFAIDGITAPGVVSHESSSDSHLFRARSGQMVFGGAIAAVTYGIFRPWFIADALEA